MRFEHWWERALEYTMLPFIFAAIGLLHFPLKVLDWIEKRRSS